MEVRHDGIRPLRRSRRGLTLRFGADEDPPHWGGSSSTRRCVRGVAERAEPFRRNSPAPAMPGRWHSARVPPPLAATLRCVRRIFADVHAASKDDFDSFRRRWKPEKGGNSFLDLSPGDGRPHRSARMRASQRTAAPDGAGRSPPPTGAGAGGWRGAPGVWLPPAKFRNGIWGVSHRHRPLRPAEGGRGTARRVVVPYGWLRRAAAIALASGAQRSVCGAVARDGWESERRLPPKGSSTSGNPSVTAAP